MIFHSMYLTRGNDLSMVSGFFPLHDLTLSYEKEPIFGRIGFKVLRNLKELKLLQVPPPPPPPHAKLHVNLKKIPIIISFTFSSCSYSIGSMSHVDFRKWSCCFVCVGGGGGQEPL